MATVVPATAPGGILPTGRIVRDWAQLAEGSWVEVVSETEPLVYARVDAVSPDGSIIWLVTAGTGLRTLHLDTDLITLYLHTP
ncbi:hypothetical protein [Arthrobacter sp. StoSoilB22]|uniref:hypothetical protein n=1 Tax=Arthrobacter sp. StoSoilB22 TaxID=2830996 RepID=UPI001CC76E76|nr:hypothetical protein [Arthrobacter sp. StoSoilB22]BCW62842.1 hypothetical protein StoSoilB22_18150 [Arthrobacter sp. StoSoilB22]